MYENPLVSSNQGCPNICQSSARVMFKEDSKEEKIPSNCPCHREANKLNVMENLHDQIHIPKEFDY
jgi:hypothetical protein